MPTIESYLPLAPFSLDELVGAVNAILRVRPEREILPRTVRYYISDGLLPPPVGAPKFAKYREEHLRRLVSIRRWIDEGNSLDQVRIRLENGDHGGEILNVGRERSGARNQKETAAELNKNAPNWRQEFPGGSIPLVAVQRMQLTPEITLEFTDQESPQRTIQLAIDALLDLQEKFT